MNFLPALLTAGGQPTKYAMRRMTALLKIVTMDWDVAYAIRGEAWQYIPVFGALTEEQQLELFGLYELSPAMPVLIGSPQELLLFREVLQEQKAEKALVRT